MRTQKCISRTKCNGTTSLYFGFRSGLRADSLEYLQLNMFKLEKVDNEEVLTVHIGSQKNHQPTMENANPQIFRQKIYTHPDERYANNEGMYT